MPGPLLSDLDGTIADTAPVIFESLRITCSKLGIELTAEKEMTWALGPPLHWCLQQLGVTDEQLEEAVAIFEEAHVARMDLITAMPGAEDVIEELAGIGVQIGVATIKPQYAAELVLDVIGLRQHIDVIHGRVDDVDPRTKTDLLRLASNELSGDRPLYVGDHANDEAAARDLGIPFLWYPQHSWDEIRDAVLSPSLA